ncbi:MAG: hypothetical protein ACYDFU_07260 [Nitrospirota bacterium]
MRGGRMFLSQKRMNEVIIYCIGADIVLGFLLKKFQGAYTAAPLALLYVLNFIVILAVYRFWKFPVFEWNEKDFTVYGINPWKRDRCGWDKAQKAGFRAVPNKKGRTREFFLVDYITPKRISKTGVIPMDMIGFSDMIKKDMQEFLKEKSIKPY